eukprot:CAMPEP_0206161266 /NCGR_PEP_ID=MMETSP1474-20131121/7502_1 /ASSEMBLY_ACC=CAM_ASM_001110 /TAXON_ID=97495 /ORGANISM="Imantonia sp., Strain RCC918" /LENGTH=52 /DNA_ID=CAMNT_0053563047 /DNA_START=429 /DNA_END=587 /DNA_ORIENTATION=-
MAIESRYLSMHIAVHCISDESSFAPGRLTHFVKHLSVTFCMTSWMYWAAIWP